jgi:catechol 2,3-dioxygenase-like lactoylglutathione lyase family enzyme
LIPDANPRTFNRSRGHLDHLCLVVGPNDVDAVATDPAFNVIDGPGPRYGARGVATSVYVTDPDGLMVEFRTYSPNIEGPPTSKESDQ